MQIASMFSNDPGAQGDQAAAEVIKRTEALLDGRPAPDPIKALRELADSLPSLDDVREVADGDTSELDEVEQEQKERTESVIRTAIATGEASVWIIAQGMERAAKGVWWRRSHDTYEQYVKDLTGRSASYVRRLRAGAPLALETAARTGRVPNPGQNEETRKVERQYGTAAAVMLFDVVTEVTEKMGAQPTAESLRAARQELPPVLPEVPEQQRAEIERVTLEALGHGGETAPEDAEGSDAHEENSNNSNDGVRIRTPEAEGSDAGESADGEDDGIVDAEIVHESLVSLSDGIKELTALNKAITKDTFVQAAEADPAEYAKLRTSLLKKATALQKKAMQAPLVYAPAPACQACGTATEPSAAGKPGRAGSYWWCSKCDTAQGDRKPL